MKIEPIQEDGLKIWGKFYVKASHIKIVTNGSVDSNYVIFYYSLLSANNREPIALSAYCFWLISDLIKIYEKTNSKEAIDAHANNLPKDKDVYIEGVLKSTAPPDFTGTMIEDIIERCDQAKRDKEKIDELFKNIICINNFYDTDKDEDFIHERFVKTAENLNENLNIYIALNRGPDVTEAFAIDSSKLKKTEMVNKDSTDEESEDKRHKL